MNKDLEITYKQLKDFTKKTILKDDDIVSVEFLIGSLYPKAYSNFEKLIGDKYHQGFMDGYLEAKKLQNGS